MPFITVELMEGRSLGARREFAARITAAAVECFETSPEKVRIRFVEIGQTELAVGGELVADRSARTERQPRNTQTRRAG